MKKAIRLLSAFLIMTVLVSTIAFAASFSDVSSDKKYFEPVSILSALGIINGYEDGTFGPENNVTRAEFSAMLMRALASGGIGDSNPAGLPFTDLGESAWAVSDIRTAYDLGIINGMTETTFEPKSNVTYEQALKMVVCALNYGIHAEEMQANMLASMPWYSGYMQVAGDLGLTDGVSYVLGQPAKRWEIAQIIYNAFDVKLLKKVEMTTGEVMYQQTSDTILANKLNVSRGSGEVVADGTNTIAADGSATREGYALIYDTNTGKTNMMAKNEISLNGLLGKSVEYYYRTDALGQMSLVYLLNRGGSNDSVEVKSSSIHRVSGTHSTGFTISYYISDESAVTNAISLAPNAVVSVNGEVEANPTAATFQIENGSLEFISNGGNYSKVNIESIETYVVKSVNRTDRYIIDMFRPAANSQNMLSLNYEDGNLEITMHNESGGELTVSSLSANSVLSVKKGKGVAGRTSYDITVSTKTATGEIGEIDSIAREIKVGGKVYKLSQYFVTYGQNILNTLSVRDNCKLYLDAQGNVAYAEKIASTSTFYGYIANAGQERQNGPVMLALVSPKITSVGSKYLTLADRVRIDGQPYSDPTQILSKLEAGANLPTANVDKTTPDASYPYTQFIKYTVNSAGLVTDIETPSAISDPATQSNDSVFQVYDVYGGQKGLTMKYTPTGREFSGNGHTFRISSSTQVYVVPPTRSDTKIYAKKTYTYFDNMSLAERETLKVEAYDIDPTMNIAKAVVVYRIPRSNESSLKSSTGLFVITEISQGIYNDENRDFVKGYEVSSSGAVTEPNKILYTESAGVIYGNYAVGDVIRYVKDNDGYVTKADNKFDEVLHIAENRFTAYVKSYAATTSAKPMKLYSGLLYNVVNNGNKTYNFQIAQTNKVSECDTSTIHTLETKTSSPKTVFFEYSKNGQTEEILHFEEFDLTGATAYKASDPNSPSAARILAYEYDGKIVAVYICGVSYLEDENIQGNGSN